MRNRHLGRCVAPLIFLLLAVPGAAQFGKNKVQYRDFDWHIYHSPHFDVYYYTDEADRLEEVVSFAESAYDTLSQRFDYQIQEPTTLIFYLTHSAFEQNNIIMNFIPEGVGAFATDVRHRMVLPIDLPDKELLALIQHELTHIFEYHILFGGKRSRAFTSRPPTWLMEGLASFMAEDESTTDRMILRDAVVNDSIPSIASTGVEGFFAYRFGAAAFRFMVETWGPDAVRDFLYEFRNTFGSKVDRALERSFRISAEDFDADFRRWLRKQYLPQLVETGEPSDFGRPFRMQQQPNSQALSPSASPSGELLVAYTTERGEVDIALWDAKNRRFLRNLTKGSTDKYQYLIGQFLTTGPRMGRDLAFSPDGNQIAVFAKREEDRALVLIDVFNGSIDHVAELGGAEQPYAPAWSPDGSRVAFSAVKDGQFDIFELEIDTGEVSHVTNDPAFDGSPVYSPNGNSVLFSSEVGEYFKIFRVDRRSGERFQITQGEWNDKEAAFSPDGNRAYFTSDRAGIDNIWKYDFENEELSQITDVVTGCFAPTVVIDEDGNETVVFTGLWKGRYDLYLADLEDAIGEPESIPLSESPVDISEIEGFEPDILVAIDEANMERYRGWRKFFLEDADVLFGVANDQTLLGQAVVRMSDHLGDRRLVLALSTVNSFQDYNIFYADLSSRLQKQLHIFDSRTYFVGYDVRPSGQVDIERGDVAYSITGAIASITYPLSFYTRVEAGVGYLFREYGFQSFVEDPNTGLILPVVLPTKNDYPVLQGAIVGDTTVFARHGPHSGRRWRLDGSYGPDLSEGGSVSSYATLDARQYIPVTRRSELAFRLFGGASWGSVPDVFYFGGLDTLRGVDFRTMVGDRAFYANFEFRFPLLDLVATPVVAFGGVRGRIFLDVGGSWFDYAGQDFQFWDSDEGRLYHCQTLDPDVPVVTENFTACPRAAYGWGMSARIFGMQMHYDLAREWDFDKSQSGWKSEFWIGNRF